MNCATHTSREAISSCDDCGDGVCTECATKLEGETICSDCVEERLGDDVAPAVRWGVILLGLLGAAAIGYFYAEHTITASMEAAVTECYNTHIANEVSPSTEGFTSCLRNNGL